MIFSLFCLKRRALSILAKTQRFTSNLQVEYFGLFLLTSVSQHWKLGPSHLLRWPNQHEFIFSRWIDNTPYRIQNTRHADIYSYAFKFAIITGTVHEICVSAVHMHQHLPIKLPENVSCGAIFQRFLSGKLSPNTHDLLAALFIWIPLHT